MRVLLQDRAVTTLRHVQRCGSLSCAPRNSPSFKESMTIKSKCVRTLRALVGYCACGADTPLQRCGPAPSSGGLSLAVAEAKGHFLHLWVGGLSLVRAEGPALQQATMPPCTEPARLRWGPQA